MIDGGGLGHNGLYGLCLLDTSGCAELGGLHLADTRIAGMIGSTIDGRGTRTDAVHGACVSSGVDLCWNMC